MKPATFSVRRLPSGWTRSTNTSRSRRLVPMCVTLTASPQASLATTFFFVPSSLMTEARSTFRT